MASPVEKDAIEGTDFAETAVLPEGEVGRRQVWSHDCNSTLDSLSSLFPLAALRSIRLHASLILTLPLPLARPLPHASILCTSLACATPVPPAPTS